MSRAPVDRVAQSRASGASVMVVSPGIVRVRGSGGSAAPVYTPPGERELATRWSARSRSRMVQRFASLGYAPMYSDPERVPVMVTLTLPGEWEALAPTPASFQRYVVRWRKRLARALGVSQLPGLWKLEFQRRGAPHLHMLVALPQRIDGEPVTAWVSRTWYEVVGSRDPRHLLAGTGIDWAESLMMTDAMRIATYFARHAAAGESKGYQHEVPGIWLESGERFRFWGYWGLKPEEVSYRLTASQTVEALRLLRKHYRATHPPVVASRVRRRRVGDTWVMSKGRLYESRRRVVDPVTGAVRYRYVYRRPVSRSLASPHRGQGGFVLAGQAPRVAAQVLRAVGADPLPLGGISDASRAA